MRIFPLEKKSSSTLKKKLYITLYWLRKYCPYVTIADLFLTSAPTISRIIHQMLPLIENNLDYIKFPEVGTILPQFMGASSAIDCTAHRRFRPHPLQCRFYNGGKGYHCLYTQLVCGLNGEIFHVYIAEGRNNDLGLLTKSHIQMELRENKMKCLGDRGYNETETVLVPLHNPQENSEIDYINHRQYHFRAVVETVFSRVKNWKAAEIKFKQNVTTQSYVLMIAYQLTAHEIKNKPLRNEQFF